MSSLPEVSAVTAALRYAATSWPVLPVRPPADRCPDTGDCQCKAPLTEHGLLDASTDPAVIRDWWRAWPDANVGIATGGTSIDVLDIDDHGEAGNGFASLNRLIRAGLVAGASAIVTTPSGGLHIYFAGSDQRCSRLPRHHLDFKALGGYVLAPPSVIHGKPYVVTDHRAGSSGLGWSAVKALLDPPRLVPPRGREATSITGLASWMARQQPGNRNCALYWASRTALESGAADLEPLATAAMSAGLSEPETRATIASALRSGGGR
jgi:hypothetical protein